MLLNSETQALVLSQLLVEDSPSVTTYLSTRLFSSAEVMQITDAATDLLTIKAQWRASLADSVAIEVDGMTLNYTVFFQRLKSDGKRLESLLSQLTGIPIKTSYFGGKSTASSFVAYG